jgi:hypothetical protein
MIAAHISANLAHRSARVSQLIRYSLCAGMIAAPHPRALPGAARTFVRLPLYKKTHASAA